MESWLDESETVAENCWEHDTEVHTSHLRHGSNDSEVVPATGTSLGSTPRSRIGDPVLNEFEAADSSRDAFSYECNNLRSRKLADENAKDLDLIGKNLGLTLDQESSLLSSPQGRREWIRKEMIRREKEFVKFKPLTIRACTWNVHGQKPVTDFSEWLMPSGSSLRDAPDLFLISFQEVQPLSGVSAVTTDASKGLLWKGATETILDAPNAYMTIAARQMVGILLIVMVKQCHEPFVRDLMLADAGTGFMRSSGNKGAVTCRFAFYDKTISVVSCHLAAHEQNVDRRNRDFHDVVRKAVFLPDPQTKQEYSPFTYLDYNPNSVPGVIGGDEPSIRHSINLLEHDVVFWIGDLNYRVQLPVDRVLKLIAVEDWKELYRYDQLENVRISGEAFQGFEEGPVDFAPTYQYERERNVYARKENELHVSRTPSWTDRVLWRDRIRTCQRNIRGNDTQRNVEAHRGIKLASYERHEIFSSDHRPVSATFKLECRIINIKLRNSVVRKIHQQLTRRENALRPRLFVSIMSVNLGDITYGQVVSSLQTPVLFRNDGRVTTRVRVLTEEFPSWLSLDSTFSREKCELAPKESLQLVFKALVTSRCGISSALNTRSANLTASPRIRIQDNSELVLSVQGTYNPTALGNRLDRLVEVVEPITEFGKSQGTPRLEDAVARVGEDDDSLTYCGANGCSLLHQSIPCDREQSESHSMLASLYAVDSQIRRPRVRNMSLPVPKELWRLTDFLFEFIASRSVVERTSSSEGNDKCSPDITSLFTCDDRNHVTQILHYVDRDLPIPQNAPIAAVGACLLELLSSLEEPVVPFSCYSACIHLGERTFGNCGVEDLNAALNTASTANINTLKYICAFLNVLLMQGEQGLAKDENIKRHKEHVLRPSPRMMEIANLFGPILLAPLETQSSKLVPNSGDEAINNLPDRGRSAIFLCHVMYAERDFCWSTTVDF